jgi:probable H4MPT-linked C1 transfer pathway protein
MVIGWDVGGAHLKACLMQGGRVRDVAQWACPLWQGLPQLDIALAQAAERWPALADATHAVTMTGEMVDCFAHREDGVCRIAARMVAWLEAPVAFFAGDRGWVAGSEVAANWEHIASANWLATARHVARWAQDRLGAGVLVDVGSTTTDLIPFRSGRVLSRSRSDAQRLACGELVYHGVVRTPLCALAPRIELQGTVFNVMNEFFATTADVYRLSGELDPAHDLHPSADGAAKDRAASQQRLARMVGLDARDATAEDWLAFAQAWRAAQVAEIAGQLQRVCAAHELPADAWVVGAGCGAFLVPDVLDAAGLAQNARALDYGADVIQQTADALPSAARWAQVCAPSVAVAALYGLERH